MRVVLVFLLTLAPASAHEWYEVRCCSGTDCRTAQDGEIIEAPGGWRIVPTGEFYRYDQAPPSPDGKFHRCLRNPADVTSSTICIYVPQGAS